MLQGTYSMCQCDARQLHQDPRAGWLAHQACRHQTAPGRSCGTCPAADQGQMLPLSMYRLQSNRYGASGRCQEAEFGRPHTAQQSSSFWGLSPSYWQARSICPITIRQTGSSSTNNTRSPAGKEVASFAAGCCCPSPVPLSFSGAAAAAAVLASMLSMTQVIVIREKSKHPVRQRPRPS